ncbi:MAG: MBL fold metallo-hydrolase [Bacillota bacterium]|nr:MBL fold metallo-hydrolase [Bacillota bacterium]
MKITYIEHSCFSVELDNVILLFDYYTGKLPEFNPEKTIYVFSSHKHQDHFSFSIFTLLKKFPQVHYILSKDIKRKFGKKFFLSQGVDEKVYNEIKFMGCSSTIETPEMIIETLTSTDDGAAFIVTAEGKSIYHAGDLNLWIWDCDSDSDNKDMTDRFMAEMEKIKGRHFDAAFLVLDPRQKDKFYLGFDYFMRVTDTDKAYPMHFWKDTSVISKIKAMECSKPYRSKIADTLEYENATV